MFKREKELMLFGLDTDQYSYKGVCLFLAIYIGASVFAAILTPFAYWIVEFVNANWPSETTRWLLGKDIDIYYDRLRWAPIIISLPIMIKECGLVSFRKLGLPLNARGAKVFLQFFLSGVLISALLYSLQFAFCNVSLRESLNSSPSSILAAALFSSIILALLEETVFRGLIFRSFYTAFGAFSGLLFTSLFFAYKHFKVPDAAWDYIPKNVATWDTGWLVAWYDTIGISIQFNPVTFASLTMFGGVLAMLYVRTKTLWSAVGFHAGLVFSIMTYRKFFLIGSSPYEKWFGNAGMTNGCAALILLSLIFLFLVFKRERNAGN